MWPRRIRGGFAPLGISLTCALVLMTGAGCADDESGNAAAVPTTTSGQPVTEGSSGQQAPGQPSGQQTPGQQPPAGQRYPGQSSGQQPPGQQYPGQQSPGQQHTEPPPKKEVNVIAWILDLGVGAPPSAAESYFREYEQLRRRDCAGVQTFDEGLVSAARMACNAAFNNKPEFWQPAKEARNEVGDPASLNCFDTAVFKVLDQLVRAHEEHPDWEFQAESGDMNETPPCPQITALTPNFGDAQTTVTIEGVHLDRVLYVMVRSPEDENGEYTTLATYYTDPDPDPAYRELELKKISDKKLEIAMPDSDGFPRACVMLFAEPSNWEMDGAIFTYGPSSDPGNVVCLEPPS